MSVTGIVFAAFAAIALVLLGIVFCGSWFGWMGSQKRTRGGRRRRRLERGLSGNNESVLSMDGTNMNKIELDFLAPEMVYLTMDEEGAYEDCCSPRAIHGGDNACVVCLDEIVDGDVVRMLPCAHEFHSTCITSWLKKRPRCPLCNSNLEPRMMVEV